MLHRGYEAWITDANKKRIKEYGSQVADGDGRTVTCSIPSESGKQFVVRWKDHIGEHHFNARIYVDGMRTRGKICQPGDRACRRGVRTTSADTYHAFQFADLQTTGAPLSPSPPPHLPNLAAFSLTFLGSRISLRTQDDDAALWNQTDLDALGTIELRIFHIRPDAGPSKPFRPHAFAGVGAVHERSKKAGVHCVTLGEAARSGRAGGTRSCKLLNPKEGPFVTFVFRYRPAALLQAEGIMSLSANHTRSKKGGRRALPAKSEIDDDAILKCEPSFSGGASPEDVIELSDDEEDYKPVQRGAGKRSSTRPAKADVKPRKRVKYDPDDVIDLT
ncbi:hypothetical protein BC628DRAFT_1417656 [Trametes gibbosa]|nr:hypothetical protein BC628DRAFT_1417656 [Trametes gibbosa]